METARASSRLAAAAAAEQLRLKREAERLEKRAEAVAAELQGLVESREEMRQQLALLEKLSPGHLPEAKSGEPEEHGPNLRSRPANGYLRGARIRAVAVRLLAASDRANQPIHYQTWFELLERAGFGIAARDPTGTFLTQITRSPVVAKATGRGLYRLDLDAPRTLHRELRQLQDELRMLHDGQQTLEAITSVRERRADLTARLARAERALEEAVAALGLEP